MDAATAEILCNLNNRFYRRHANSFSETRKAPWQGWERCVATLRSNCPAMENSFSVFDLACGNLRFEAFMASAFPEATITFYAVDNCDILLPQTPSVHYQSLDVLGVLHEGGDLDGRITTPPCDLSVSFGFMHHIPFFEWRKDILSTLVRHTKPGGYVVVSLWQFMKNEDLAQKARVTSEQARHELGIPQLDTGDFLLGWKNIPGEYRYCHNFSEEEIDRLVSSLAGKASVVERFAADGRTGNLNTYVILNVL